MRFYCLLYFSRTFPYCKFGEKCLYIHPNCKYDAKCTRMDCPFTHATRRAGGFTPTVIHQCKCFFYLVNAYCWCIPKIFLHIPFQKNGYTFKGSNSAIFSFASLLSGCQLLTLLHSERPKLYTILVFLSAKGFKTRILS